MPPAARGVFSSAALTTLERYAQLLATTGVERGLLGPREVPRLWERHLLNCAALAPVLPEGSRVADVGSGAGLPGVVLAVVRPDLHLTLIEPLLRRSVFLEEAVAAMGLERVQVLRARAEDLRPEPGYDVVTSRAVAPLGRLLGWCMPLTAPRGVVLALKGASVHDEVAAVRPELARRGWAEPEVMKLEVPTGEPVRAVRVRWADSSRAPRRSGPARSGRAARRRDGPRRGR